MLRSLVGSEMCIRDRVDVLKKEWAKLRDNYRKTLVKREKCTRSGAGSKKLPTCNFFEELSFLCDSVSNRSSATNIPSVFSQSPPSPCMVTTEGSSGAESATPTPTLPTALPKSDVKFGAQKRKRTNGDEADLLLVKTLDKHLSLSLIHI